MDTEEIARLVRDLKVSGESVKEAVVISKEEAAEGKKRLEKVVVGKIFSRRVLTREMIRSNLPRILRSRGSTEIEVVGANLFVINFTLDSDKKVALEEGPWHFFQDLMILKQSKAMQTPMEVEFDEISLWIQCHNVPLECMEPHIIKRIGEQVGKVEEVDVGEHGSCVGKFARVRVSRLIKEPLVRYVPLKQEGLEKDVIVLLQYEKLPGFCFVCGCVGHISRDCGDESVDRSNPRFGSWLRAGRTYGGRGGGEGGSWFEERSSSLGISASRGTSRRLRVGADVTGVLEGSGGSRLKAREDETIGEEEELVESSRADSLDAGVKEMEVAFPDRELGAPHGDVGGAGDQDRARLDVVLVRELGSEAGGAEKGMELPPVKAQPRTGGRGWKRLARAKRGDSGGESSVGAGGGSKGGSVKRKMGLLRDEEDVVEEGHQLKQARTSSDVLSENPTAVAAAQPRRSS